MDVLWKADFWQMEKKFFPNLGYEMLVCKKDANGLPIAKDTNEAKAALVEMREIYKKLKKSYFERPPTYRQSEAT